MHTVTVGFEGEVVPDADSAAHTAAGGAIPTAIRSEGFALTILRAHDASLRMGAREISIGESGTIPSKVSFLQKSPSNSSVE